MIDYSVLIAVVLVQTHGHAYHACRCACLLTLQDQSVHFLAGRMERLTILHHAAYSTSPRLC